jgi:hypothetical protein
MSIRGGKTRGQKRPLSVRQTTGDDSQSRDIHTLLMLELEYQLVLLEKHSQYELDT